MINASRFSKPSKSLGSICVRLAFQIERYFIIVILLCSKRDIKLIPRVEWCTFLFNKTTDDASDNIKIKYDD